MQTSISQKIPVEIMSMENALFVLTGFSTGPRKAEKPAFPMPAIGCGHRLYPLSRHTQRGFTKMAHSAAVGSGHHHPTGNCKPSHRQGVWTTSTSGSVRPPGSERETHRNPWGMQNMAPRRIYFAAHQYKPSTTCCPTLAAAQT